ncbi:gamma-glutamylcyclotransferase (plasmid) [Paracoccus liaowanqingii]|uniref:glutathione-specific gamma-glutamylcyclotransferase n=1 Tax=Paracoccus liaowanqingii TaxID=2560053 RepID=A0A4Y5SS62_9RHOB|nr:gamma-glutamylcyclotransferase [Paracoccus liaowanqingii]QDA35798.1 gamma-glutamylcyclotransferase [Paracoccus liaowanqingii]
MQEARRSRQARHQLTLTPELVARCGSAIPQDPHDRFTFTSEADFDAALEHHLSLAEGAPLQIFAYGSLIWNPGFEVAERTPGTALGWRRVFGISVERARGSREKPGYMLTLAPGGRCRGVLLRVAENDRRAALSALVRREYPYREFLPQTRRIQVATRDGVTPALAFWAGRFAPLDALDHTEEQIAFNLAHACGFLGSGAEYLYRTVTGLIDHQIRDPYLDRIGRMVAEEISRWEPPTP